MLIAWKSFFPWSKSHPMDVKDAADCHFDAAEPRIIRLHIVKDEIPANAVLK